MKIFAACVAFMCFASSAHAEAVALPPVVPGEDAGSAPPVTSALEDERPPARVSADFARRQLVEQRFRAEDAHLLRLGAWGVASMALGGAILVGMNPGVLPQGFDVRPALGFGIQCLAWGGIDTAIVGLAFLGDRLAPDSLDGALDEENKLGDLLWLNVGLDAGYMLAGAAMVGAGFAGAEPAVDWTSHGIGVVVQGAALLVLDGVFVSSQNERRHLFVDVLRNSSMTP